MITVSVTEFKAHCLRLMEQARASGETIEIVKRGRPFATVVPRRAVGCYRAGQFKGIVKIAGKIEVDGNELGIEWDALA